MASVPIVSFGCKIIIFSLDEIGCHFLPKTDQTSSRAGKNGGKERRDETTFHLPSFYGGYQNVSDLDIDLSRFGTPPFWGTDP